MDQDGGDFFQQMDIDSKDTNHQQDAGDAQDLGKLAKKLGFLQDAALANFAFFLVGGDEIHSVCGECANGAAGVIESFCAVAVAVAVGSKVRQRGSGLNIVRLKSRSESEFSFGDVELGSAHHLC